MPSKRETNSCYEECTGGTEGVCFSFQKANINTVKFQFEELVVNQKIDKCIM